MANTKPLIGAAFVCEKILTEKDGVHSAIRIVDTFTMGGGQNVTAQKQKSVIHLNAFVMLKSGDLTGRSEVGIVAISPSGQRTEFPARWPIALEGGTHGVSLILSLDLEVTEMGLYWLEVIWQNEVLTSIPFKLQAKPPAPQEPPATD